MTKREICALMGCCALLAASCAESIERQAYCDELPQAICERIFDADCDIGGQARYTDQQACLLAERTSCRALADDEALAFDGEQAFGCVDQVNSAACDKVLRADFHACEKVFAELERPARSIDAGVDQGASDAR